MPTTIADRELSAIRSLVTSNGWLLQGHKLTGLQTKALASLLVTMDNGSEDRQTWIAFGVHKGITAVLRELEKMKEHALRKPESAEQG